MSKRKRFPEIAGPVSAAGLAASPWRPARRLFLLVTFRECENRPTRCRLIDASGKIIGASSRHFGAEIDPDRVPEMLKQPTAVVNSPTVKIDKAFRDALKDNTLIVVLPPPPTTPALAK